MSVATRCILDTGIDDKLIIVSGSFAQATMSYDDPQPREYGGLLQLGRQI